MQPHIVMFIQLSGNVGTYNVVHKVQSQHKVNDEKERNCLFTSVSLHHHIRIAEDFTFGLFVLLCMCG